MPEFDLSALREAPWEMVGAYAHQVDAIEQWLLGGPRMVAHPQPGRGIIWAPTASGKGRIAAGIAHAVPGRWLFAVHRGHLALDVRGRWEKLTGTEAGFIGDGQWTEGERLTCATLQSLYAAKGTPRYAGLVERVTGVITDESHTAPAATFYSVLQSFRNARLRVGLSGTPLDRGDRRSMVAVGAIGPVVYRILAKTLQDRGVLAVPTVRIVPVYQSLPDFCEWRQVYESLICRSKHRNGAVLAAMAKAKAEGEVPGIVFVRSVDHGRTLTKLANAQGITTKFVHGSATLPERKAACQQLESGRTDFIVATKVFTEGVDIPSLATVINAQGGKSVIDTLQQIGRGMRVTKNKTTVTVWEFGDKGNPWTNSHAKARVAACQREGYRCIVDHTLWPERATERTHHP